jgi:hypothetical protein
VRDLPVERSVWQGYCESSATPARWVRARGAHNVRCAERGLRAIDRSQPSRAPRAGREPRQCRQFRERPHFLLLCGARSYRCGHGVRGDGLVRRAAAPDNNTRAFGGNRVAMTKHSAQGAGPFQGRDADGDRGTGARSSCESRTGRSNSIVFGHKVRGGRLTCARHPWDIFKVTRCCRVVGGLRVLFSLR